MGFLLLSAISQANAAWTVNMAPGATEVSRSVFDLHMTIFWICVVIGVLVFGAMFWSMIVHRRSTGQQRISTRAPRWKSSGRWCRS